LDFAARPLTPVPFSRHLPDMNIPWQELQPETLRSLIEDFVSRDGTDYGAEEISAEKKMEQVLNLLKNKQAQIVFDPITESCGLVDFNSTK
jgi:uncharacterized protein YheU (UPF0270 family)